MILTGFIAGDFLRRPKVARSLGNCKAGVLPPGGGAAIRFERILAIPAIRRALAVSGPSTHVYISHVGIGDASALFLPSFIRAVAPMSAELTPVA
ncbi:hypothetical protein [Ollibium composti]|uniref:Uncharacterized protein n=1 Tax=Ollibium composti TaxID=2675109 RepID=A0ABY2Q7H2_9HYPH|nr:hypothetical protein [Mesorhizobium composti]THF57127.1 hypothetical protein E6C48_12485 [Mesorhizobium composti]